MFKHSRQRPCWGFICWATVLCSLTFECHALRCVHSGMCSLGQLRPFHGDIGTTEGLKAALAARSYKKELIVMVTKANSMLAARMALENFARLGIEHVLLIGGHEPEACTDILPHVPHIGCAWEGNYLPVGNMQSGSVHALWKTRFRVLARAVRMGYNVLSTDSDVMIFDDPYRYFKSPPFKDYNVINQAEVLYEQSGYPHNSRPNGGIIYVQNAKPDGPVAYMLAETEERHLRWAEDGFKWSRQKGLHDACDEVDQDALSDALSSMAMGRPQFVHASSVCWEKPPSLEIKQKIERHVATVVHNAWQRDDNVELPNFMWPAAGSNATTLRWLKMIMPHTEGVWPEEFGGKWYPDVPLGPKAKRFRELLRNDTDSPLWPDPEDNSTLAAARAVPPEKYLYAPPWLIFGYFPRGTDAVWLPDTEGAIQQVIGHAHYLPPTDTRGVGKLAARQAVGYYDWTTAHEVQNNSVFFANIWSNSIQSRPKEVVHDVPRLLVLHPRLHLDQIQNYAELMQVLQGAMQVAILSNRTLVWPDLPCTLPWIAEFQNDTLSLKQKYRGNWYPFGQRSASGLTCMFARVMHGPCLQDHRGMLGTEYLHYKYRYGIRYDMHPHYGNTAFFPAHDQLHTVLNLRPNGPVSAVVTINSADATHHLKYMQHAPVLFLAHTIKVTDLDINAGSIYQHCLTQQSLSDILPNPTADLGRMKVYPGTLKHGRLHAAVEPAGNGNATALHKRSLAGKLGRLRLFG